MLTAGTLLDGKFEVVKPLGQGGFGEVFLARQQAFDRMVAVKTLRAQEVDEESDARFCREAKLLSMLSHPNIATFLGYGISDGVRYMVLEYIEGETLHNRISERGQLTLQETLMVAKQVAGALAHAHSLGIVHRDLKPANIIFAKGLPGEPLKLIDFGLAHVETPVGQRLTQEGVAVGTALYMSPEQCIGKSVDGRSDLYSLGCILFQCLKGVPPYDDDSSVGIMFKHLNDPIPPCEPAQNSQLYEVMVTLLAKEPDERYQTAEELCEALAKCDLSKKSSARIPVVASSTKNRTVSKSLLLAALGAILVTMGGAYNFLSKKSTDLTPSYTSIPTGPFAAEIRETRALPLGYTRSATLRSLAARLRQQKDSNTAEQILLPEYQWVKKYCPPLEVARFQAMLGASALENGDEQVAHEALDAAVKGLSPLASTGPGLGEETANVLIDRYRLAKKLNEQYMVLHAAGAAYETACNAAPTRWTGIRSRAAAAYVEQLWKVGKLNAASDVCKEALRACSTLPVSSDATREAYWARAAADTESRRGNAQAARDLMLRSVRAAQKNNQTTDLIAGYRHLVDVDLALGRRADAINDLENALHLMKKSHLRTCDGITRRSLKERLRELGGGGTADGADE